MNTQVSIHRRDFLALAGAGLAAASAGSQGTALAQEKASPVAATLPSLTIKQQPVARMLSQEVFVTLRRLHMRQAMTDANCLITYSDKGYRGRQRPALVRAEKHRPRLARVLPGTDAHPFDGRPAPDLEPKLRSQVPLLLRQAQPAYRSRLKGPRAHTWQHLRDIETNPKRAFSNPGCRFTRDGRAILQCWTCKYLPNWSIQDIIDLRVAVIHTAWIYEASP